MADEDSQEIERAEPVQPGGGGGGGGAVIVPGGRGGRGGGGFFSIYKKGQGYWTRMGTALAAGLIAVLFANFVYTQMRSIPVGKDAGGNPTYINNKISLATAAAICGVIVFFAWRLMNKPGHVDFLIATDSEMKKVNWTTRKELIGSTKVVIFFVLLISAILFLLDLFFGYLFYAIKVLAVPPF